MALTVSRKPGLAVVLTGDIRITVSKVGQRRVELSISAPPDIWILRSELLRDEAQSALRTGAQPKRITTARLGGQGGLAWLQS